MLQCLLCHLDVRTDASACRHAVSAVPCGDSRADVQVVLVGCSAAAAHHKWPAAAHHHLLDRPAYKVSGLSAAPASTCTVC